MIPEKIISRKPISMAQANDLLKEIIKERKEPTYEQDMSLKYFDKFNKLTASKAEKLTEELGKVEGVDSTFAVKVADILPETKEVLQMLLPKNSKISEADLEKIFSLVKKYQK